MRTCTVEGCPRAHRAKGLCSTHYNQANYTAEQRNPKSPVHCAVCGAMFMKANGSIKKYENSFCSRQCFSDYSATSEVVLARVRAAQLVSQTANGTLAWRERQKAAAASRQKERRAELASKLADRPCDECGSVFTPNTTRQHFCAKACTARVKSRARRGREFGAYGTFAWTDVIRLHLLFGRRCAYCVAPILGQPDPDHVIPLSRGGHNTIGNILPCCKPCNSDKRDLLLHEWAEDRARRGIPSRTTTWDVGDARYAHLTAQHGWQLSHSA